MKIIIKESPLAAHRGKIGMDLGWGNGYVLIPSGHHLHGVPYEDIIVDVHGGLTYSALVTPKLIEVFELHLDDLGAWMVGFDTAHYKDTLERWPKEAVQAETERLRDQLINYKFESNGTNN